MVLWFTTFLMMIIRFHLIENKNACLEFSSIDFFIRTSIACSFYLYIVIWIISTKHFVMYFKLYFWLILYSPICVNSFFENFNIFYVLVQVNINFTCYDIATLEIIYIVLKNYCFYHLKIWYNNPWENFSEHN